MDAPADVEPMLCLASQSSRRRALLTQIAVAHSVRPAHIDETARLGEDPRTYVERMAHTKAQSVWPQARPLAVLAADTIVVVEGVICGKPRDRAHGLSMLASLSGREHLVLTAVALATGAGVGSRLSASTVRLRAMSPAERAAYWESGEPRDKAGAYAIQGLGAVFVESLHGSYSGVMGLPLYETAQLLDAARIPYGWHAGAPA
jgi:septum formation protein